MTNGIIILGFLIYLLSDGLDFFRIYIIPRATSMTWSHVIDSRRIHFLKNLLLKSPTINVNFHQE
jgi:hypothetical protein